MSLDSLLLFWYCEDRDVEHRLDFEDDSADQMHIRDERNIEEFMDKKRFSLKADYHNALNVAKDAMASDIKDRYECLAKWMEFLFTQVRQHQMELLQLMKNARLEVFVPATCCSEDQWSTKTDEGDD